MIMNERNVKDLRDQSQAQGNVNITNIGMGELPKSHSPTKSYRVSNV